MKEKGKIASAKKRSVKSVAFLRSVLTVGVVSLFCAALILSSWYRQCINAVDDAHNRFISSTATADRHLHQLQYTLAEISVDSNLYSAADGRLSNSVDYLKITETMRSGAFARKQNEFAHYLEAFFMVPAAGCNHILSSDGAYRRDLFFDTHYKNSIYTDAFWQAQLEESFVFRLYTAAHFDSTRDSAVSRKLLVPISYKMPENRNFVFVCLFDLMAIPGMADNSRGESMAVLGANGSLIAEQGDCNFSKIFSSDRIKSIERVDGGYLFRTSSALDDIVYYRWTPYGSIFGTINLLHLIFLLLLALVTAAALLISRYFAKKDAHTIAQIGAALTGDSSQTGLAAISDGIASLMAENEKRVEEINQKDTLLRAVFLQSRMRDIYVSIDDMENQISISQKFVLVYFRVNFREQYRKNINEEQGKIAFYLKQLIELYLANAQVDATTFQVESDQIVSVVNVNSGASGISDIMDSIVTKLNNESEYVFFTIVISDLYEDISSLKRIYDQMHAISKYARPVATGTQVLKESEIKPGAGRFYFSVEQMEKLTAMLQNENPEDSVRLLDEILDYNIKKDVNGFDLYLLCTEIVNCAVKLINRLFHNTPASLRVAETYSRLDKAVALDQYREICKALIEQAVEYIRINKREEDYIISYILDYVEKHYTEDIYLNLFAEKLNLTGAYISSYFKSKMNVNLSDYINSFRIKRAVALVEDPHNPLLKNKDIAERVGLQNINTFIRLFKKYTGYTPGEYRKKHVSE